MTSARNALFPKSAYGYGEYRWHYAWTVDVVARTAIHRNGAVYEFTPGKTLSLRPPAGGVCPGGAWSGKLTVPATRRKPRDEQAAIRQCREALQLFGDLASFICQDCATNTFDGDYYMVHNDLWKRAHPNVDGMLCLPCLEVRVGRRLRMDDFTGALVNSDPRIRAFCEPDDCKSVVRE